MDHPVGEWIEALAQNQAPQRRQAILGITDYLKHHENPQLMMRLVSHVLHENNATLATMTIQAIGRLKLYSAVESLLLVLRLDKTLPIVSQPEPALTDDARLNLRRAAIQALGQIGDARVIPTLLKVLNNKRENYRLRLAAAECLGKLGDPKATNTLVDVLIDERESSLYLRESAAKALGMLGDIRALESLIEVLESKRGFRNKFNFLKEQIIEALGHIGRPNNRVMDSLYAALNDEAPSIRLAAVQALEQLGDEETILALYPMLFDVEFDVACAVANALFNLGGEEVVQKALADDNLPHTIRLELEAYIP
jgi:HEAT repeat protein